MQQITNRWATLPPVEIKKAAESGDAGAQYFWYMTEWNAASQEQDFAYAQWRLKKIAPKGPPVPPAEVEANRAKWAAVPESEARQAAEAGDPGAQQYLTRLGSDRALERRRNSVQWLQKAAERSCPPAEYQLAALYLAPFGTPPLPHDPNEGLKWLRRAVDHGFESAQHRLGDLLLEGEFLPVDVAAAVDYLRLAADQGCPRAQFELAQQYACGNGEPRSAAETPLSLFTKAAKAGWAEARYVLGERYRLGLSVAPSRAKAFFWLNLAAGEDSREAARRLNRLKASLTPDDYRQLSQWSDKLGRWPE